MQFRVSGALALTLLLGLAPLGGLVPCAQAQAIRFVANPSALIAADIATTHAMERKGWGEGLAETMAKDAQVLSPPRALAEVALHDLPHGEAPHLRQPDGAWIGCDGTYGVTRGRWSAKDAQGQERLGGWYATVWQRNLKKGFYRWSLTLEAPTAQALPAPDFLTGLVADCPVRRPRTEAEQLADLDAPRPPKLKKGAPPPMRPLRAALPAENTPAGADTTQGQSYDGTLAWRATVLPDGGRRFRAWMWKDGAMQEVIHLDAAPPRSGTPNVTVGS